MEMLKNNTQMDSEPENSEKTGDSCTDPSDVFQSVGVRRDVRSCDEIYRIILGNRWHFLLHVSPIFWIILLFGKK